ncbi:MAG TPA: HDOD domain-containing protein [Planctomycetota bacterium]|nr:HDOD domain-containing protein [Planctomycetota bacterium]
MTPTHTLQSILDDIKSLEPLPQVALRVMTLSSKDDLVPRELVEVIQTDAGLTGKVLKLCNSAYYGFRREIASLPEAGNLLGCSTLVNLVVTSCTALYFRNYGGQSADAARNQWQRSISTAISASLLAEVQGNVDRNRCYTVGLLENVGHLVMERFLPDLRAELASLQAKGATHLEAEYAVLGIHHGQIGAQLAERWDFPDVLVEAIRHHHAPQDARIDPTLVGLAHLAEMAAQRHEEAEGRATDGYELCESALVQTGMTRARFDELEPRLAAEIRRAEALIDL